MKYDHHREQVSRLTHRMMQSVSTDLGRLTHRQSVTLASALHTLLDDTLQQPWCCDECGADISQDGKPGELEEEVGFCCESCGRGKCLEHQDGQEPAWCRRCGEKYDRVTS